MATAPNQSGAFIPTSFIFDISQIYETNTNTPEFKELIVKLYQYLNQIALAVNIKESAMYPLQEFVNGQLYFPNPNLKTSTTTVATQRQVFRTVVNFGALPNAATNRMAHNINPNSAFTFTKIYGCATNPSGTFLYYPLPYSSTTDVAHNIELWADNTYVYVKSPTNYSAFTVTYIVLEYLKF